MVSDTSLILFCTWLSSFPNSIYAIVSFLIVCSWHHCHKLFIHITFLDSRDSSTAPRYSVCSTGGFFWGSTVTNACVVKEVSPQLYFTFSQSFSGAPPVLRSLLTISRNLIPMCNSSHRLEVLYFK